MILGLDISTSIIGYNICKLNWELVTVGHVNMTKNEGGTIAKAQQAISELLPLFKQFQITRIAAEEALKKFSVGKSSAQTLTLLAAFNFGIVFTLFRETGIKVEYVSVSTARKKLGFKFPKRTPAQAKKLAICRYCEAKYTMVPWPKTKTGKPKPWCLDIADSLIITESVLL